jgi:TetR/AcrR family transcriptional regulator, transcriptional repressor for nem operon
MKNDTRERLIDSARRLFWQHGYGATGIAQILKEADAGSGSLYYFFPTKEDLLLAVLQWYKTMLCPMVVQPVCQRVSDPIERVFGILDGYRKQLLASEFQSGCPIGNLALEVCNGLPAARQLVAENFSGWTDEVRKCLDAAKGRLPAMDTANLARFVLVTMEGAVMLARAYRSIESYDGAVTQLRDYFERLLRDGTEWASPKGASSHEASLKQTQSPGTQASSTERNDS